jgi:tRNA threonylcarbamoyladenosine biosynthesis protein TsaB
MSFILSLETSAKICSVAIHNNGTLITTEEIHIEHSHASKLAVLIDAVCKKALVELQQLSAIAVSSGPGSYTGLRIGTSTAKGLCFALNIPLISIGSLELLSHHMNKQNPDQAYLCPMIDARRMEVYCTVVNASGETIQPIEAKVIDTSSFTGLLEKNKIIFFGDGADKCRETLKHSNAQFVSGIYPIASYMGELAFNKFQKQQTEDLVNFEPYYLKEFMIKKSVVKPVN